MLAVASSSTDNKKLATGRIENHTVTYDMIRNGIKEEEMNLPVRDWILTRLD